MAVEAWEFVLFQLLAGVGKEFVKDLMELRPLVACC
jgi:hypothetical protein